MSAHTRGLEVMAIARQCRRALETPGQVSNDLLARLYGIYLPHESFGLTHYLEAVRPGFPLDNCQLSTVFLRHHIGYGVIENGYFRQPDGTLKPHTFVNLGATVMGEQSVADITSDQFPGGEEVYVGPLAEPWIPCWQETLPDGLDTGSHAVLRPGNCYPGYERRVA